MTRAGLAGGGAQHHEAWGLSEIQAHVAEHLPIAPLLGLEVTHAEPGRALVRLVDGPHILRPGGVVSGPVMFAMADLCAWAAILARLGADAVTATLTINFLRPAATLPLIAEARPLRAGRRLLTFEIHIYPEADLDTTVAHATASWAVI